VVGSNRNFMLRHKVFDFQDCEQNLFKIKFNTAKPIFLLQILEPITCKLIVNVIKWENYKILKRYLTENRKKALRHFHTF